MNKEFQKLMSELTITKNKIEKNRDHRPGFADGFTLAGQIVWKHRHMFQCSEVKRTPTEK